MRSTSGTGEKNTIYGHFSLFHDDYEINSFYEGRFIERIAPGAFKDTFAHSERGIKLLYEHGNDPMIGNKPIGRITKLEEDERGAYYEGTLYRVDYVDQLRPALEDGQLGASFRFRVLDEEWDETPPRTASNPEGLPVRTITKVEVVEAGPVTFGANPRATASVRSLTDAYTTDLALKRRASESLHNDEQVKVEVAQLDASAGESDSSVRNDETLTSEESIMSERADKSAEDEAPEEETDEARTTKYDKDGNPDPNGKYDKDGNLLEGESEEDAADEDESEEEAEEEEAKRSVPQSDNAKKGTAVMAKSLDELRAEIAEIDARSAEIDAEAGDTALSAEARSEYTELEARRATLVTEVEAIEKRRKAVAERSAQGTGERAFGAPAVHVKPENVYDVYAAFRGASTEGDVVRAMKDNAKRIVEERRFDGSNVAREDNQAHVSELLAKHDKDGAVSRHLMVTGSPEYQRAWSKYMNSKGMPVLTSDEARALELGVDANGGYKVPFDLDPTVILTSAGVINPLREMATVKQVVGKEWQGVTSAGTSVTRASGDGEGEAVTIQSPTFGQVRANTQRVDFRVDFSIEIDAADPANMSDLVTLLREAKDAEEADTFVTGTGNGLTGVQGVSGGLPSGSKIELTSAFSSDHLYDLDDALDPRHQANAQFLARKSTYNLIRRLGADTDGGDLWVRLPGANPNELIGYPARVASHMPAYEGAGSTTDPFLILGDFSKYLIVDRIGMVMAVDPFTVNGDGKHTGQRSLVAYWWNGGVMIDGNAFRGLVDAA